MVHEMKKGVKTVLFAEALSDKTNKDDIKDITLVFLYFVIELFVLSLN